MRHQCQIPWEHPTTGEPLAIICIVFQHGNIGNPDYVEAPLTEISCLEILDEKGFGLSTKETHSLEEEAISYAYDHWYEHIHKENG